MPALSIGGKAPGSSLAATAKKAATNKVTTKKPASTVVTKPKNVITIANDGAPLGTPMVGSVGENISQGVLPNEWMAGQPSEAPAPATPAWTLETDPAYRSAMSAGQSSFNYARNAALADQQNTQTAKAAERKALDVNATEARRRTAGNYAARGMAGGAAGVLTQAEARANAEQIAARTNIQDQLAAVNQNYLANYGAIGSDWTGTLVGQQYKTQAAQQALESALARYGTV
jgi:hypothetical protein